MLGNGQYLAVHIAHNTGPFISTLYTYRITQQAVQTHALLTAGIEQCLRYLEPLLPVLVVVSVGELEGDVGDGAYSLLGVRDIVNLHIITGKVVIINKEFFILKDGQF